MRTRVRFRDAPCVLLALPVTLATLTVLWLLLWAAEIVDWLWAECVRPR